jgi:hypothetical protein
MAVRKIITDRQRARKVYGFVQRLPDKISLAELAAESAIAVAALDWKESVRVASTTNINLASTSTTTVDGVTIVVDDRILLKNQSTLSQNGIYVAASSVTPGRPDTWVRADDAVPLDTLTKGATVYVEEGPTSGQKRYVLINITDLGGDQTWQLDVTVPGSNTQIVFNDSGVLGASANFTFNKGTNILTITGTTNGQTITPLSDATYNLGSPSFRWANVYTGDLHLRNDKGDWTLIEDENILLLRNNKTDKMFKFVIEPVDQ